MANNGNHLILMTCGICGKMERCYRFPYGTHRQEIAVGKFCLFRILKNTKIKPIDKSHPIKSCPECQRPMEWNDLWGYICGKHGAEKRHE